MVGKVVFKSPTLGERGVGNLKGIRFEFMTQLEAIGIPEWMLDVDIQHFALFLTETGKGEQSPTAQIWDEYTAWMDERERDRDRKDGRNS